MNQSVKAELEAIMHMYRQRRYDECLKIVKAKLKKSPDSLHLLNYQAMAYSALKKDREALQSYENILKKRPITCWPLLQYGAYFEKKWKARRGNS